MSELRDTLPIATKDDKGVWTINGIPHALVVPAKLDGTVKGKPFDEIKEGNQLLARYQTKGDQWFIAVYDPNATTKRPKPTKPVQPTQVPVPQTKPKPAPKPATPAPKATPLDPSRLRVIHTPGGDLLSDGLRIKLESTEEEAVVAWCEELRTWGLGKNVYFNTNALCYFARQFYEFHTPEFKRIREAIRGTYVEKDAEVLEQREERV